MAARMKMRMIRANAIADTVGIVISMTPLPPASIEKINHKLCHCVKRDFGVKGHHNMHRYRERLWCEGAS